MALSLCMYGMLHPLTKLPVWTGLILLTNAPWLMALGVTCDKSHHHAPLVDRCHVAQSSAYSWGVCDSYAQAPRRAPSYLKLAQQDKPVQCD